MRLRMSDICTKEPVARSATANTPQFGADKCRLAHSRVTTQEAANTTTRKGEREGEWAKSTLTYEILVSIHRYEVRVENDVRVVGMAWRICTHISHTRMCVYWRTFEKKRRIWRMPASNTYANISHTHIRQNRTDIRCRRRILCYIVLCRGV